MTLRQRRSGAPGGCVLTRRLCAAHPRGLCAARHSRCGGSVMPSRGSASSVTTPREDAVCVPGSSVDRVPFGHWRAASRRPACARGLRAPERRGLGNEGIRAACATSGAAALAVPEAAPFWVMTRRHLTRSSESAFGADRRGLDRAPGHWTEGPGRRITSRLLPEDAGGTPEMNIAFE